MVRALVGDSTTTSRFMGIRFEEGYAAQIEASTEAVLRRASKDTLTHRPALRSKRGRKRYQSLMIS